MIIADNVHVHFRRGLLRTQVRALNGLSLEVREGDFFAAVPAGADVYLLSSIVHNWDEADARAILARIGEAMGAAGRVIVLEMVLPDDDSPHTGKELDMGIMGLFKAGRERTLAEYTALLASAGLRITEVVELTRDTSAIVAARG